MGLYISKQFVKREEVRVKPKINIIMVGLEGAGKTTILNQLKLGDMATTTTPTHDFNVETIVYKNIRFRVWDVGEGHDENKTLWHQYLKNTQIVIFVVDSSDNEDHIQKARNELYYLLMEKELHKVSLLVFANKQDIPNARTVTEFTEMLDLPSITQRPWHIQATSATTGLGLYEGFEWLANKASEKKVVSKMKPEKRTGTAASTKEPRKKALAKKKLRKKALAKKKSKKLNLLTKIISIIINKLTLYTFRMVFIVMVIELVVFILVMIYYIPLMLFKR